MSKTHLSLQDKISELRQRFIEQFPARLAIVTEQHQRLSEAPIEQARLAPELHRFFHSVKGTGNTLRFPQLAAIADQAETLITRKESALFDAEILAELGSLLERMMEVHALESHALGLASTAYDFEPDFELNQEQSAASTIQNPRLIYLCDDEPDQVAQLMHHLRCFGHDVVHFSTTEAFFDAVLMQPPDAVIMDVHFPQGKIAGTETLANLKRLTDFDLPAIVLSGHGDFTSRLSAVRAGCQGYFIKPVKPLGVMLALDELTTPKKEEPLRVLLVDDEPQAASYHALLLEEAGMVVKAVHLPSEAFAALERFSPDLLLVDFYMPACSGKELASIIRQQPEYIGLPILYLSSETDSRKQLSAMGAGVEAFLTKPVVPEELVTTVQLHAERLRLLRSLMIRDSMTGLYNHSTTTELIGKSLARASRNAEAHTMAMIDIDSFKEVNDTHGHLAGDQVIVTLARLLQSRLRQSDIIGRYGGEEFVVLLKQTTAGQARDLMDVLREDFSRIDFHTSDHCFRCTFSVGISAFPRHASTEPLRLAADQALYRAKALGRNRVEVDP